MPEISLVLKNKQEIARSTMEFVFEKPEGFDYKPGQFMTLIYKEQPYKDKKGDRRAMSFASSPTEEVLSFGMRMSMSAYKRSMSEAKPGAKMSGLGPVGRFVMPEDESKELVFLAGGIGITPFRSMVKFATDKKLQTTMTLVYCNNCLRDASYLEDFIKWEKENGHFTLVPTMTDPNQVEKEWDGRCGVIDEKLLKEFVADVKKPTYMIVGPTPMVVAMEKLLDGLGVPKEQVIIEKFTGYDIH